MATDVIHISIKITWRARIVLFYAEILLALGVDLDLERVGEIFFNHCKVSMR